MKSQDGQVMGSVTTRQITLNAILMEVTVVVQKLILHTVLNVFVTGLFVCNWSLSAGSARKLGQCQVSRSSFRVSN